MPEWCCSGGIWIKLLTVLSAFLGPWKQDTWLGAHIEIASDWTCLYVRVKRMNRMPALGHEPISFGRSKITERASMLRRYSNRAPNATTGSIQHTVQISARSMETARRPSKWARHTQVWLARCLMETSRRCTESEKFVRGDRQRLFCVSRESLCLGRFTCGGLFRTLSLTGQRSMAVKTAIKLLQSMTRIKLSLTSAKHVYCRSCLAKASVSLCTWLWSLLNWLT